MISSYFPFIVIDVVDSEPGYKDNTSDSAMIGAYFLFIVIEVFVYDGSKLRE